MEEEINREAMKYFSMCYFRKIMDSYKYVFKNLFYFCYLGLDQATSCSLYKICLSNEMAQGNIGVHAYSR